MSRKITIPFVAVLVIGVALFLLTRGEDPLVAKAKAEVRQAEATLAAFQNTINAIPTLELSRDVENDFRMQVNYLGFMGNVDPDSDALPPPTALSYASKFISASEARGSPKLIFDFDTGMEKVLGDAVAIAEVTREDLGLLERTANTFDEAVRQAKAGVSSIVPLSVERNSKIERYFLELDRIDRRLKALSASLDAYSSADFRLKIKRLRSANGVFGDIARYTFQLISDKARGYPLEVAKSFPEFAVEEAAVRRCARFGLAAAPAGCEPAGFLPGQFQPLLRKLSDMYGGLVE